MAVKNILPSDFAAKSYFPNMGSQSVVLSVILALEAYFTETIFPGDSSRIIYASNEFAFRRRMQTNSKSTSAFTANNLNMPFLNFALKSGGIDLDTADNYKNKSLATEGLMDWDTELKLKALPVKLSFEATFFTTVEADLHYMASKFSFINLYETIIPSYLELTKTDGLPITFKNWGKFNNVCEYNTKYTEADWLKQNKIKTISLDFSVDTYFISINDHEDYWVPKTVLASFAFAHDLVSHDLADYDTLYSAVIDHLTSTVS